MFKLLVAISYHGFGHLAQTAVVLRRLHRLLPLLKISVVSAAPPDILRHMLDLPCEHIQLAADTGMTMHDALRVDATASDRAYQEYHRHWHHHLDTAIHIVEERRPQLVLSNISYTYIAAAAHCGIPAVALCSLNWHDIYERYCAQAPGAPAILDCMREHYAAARSFLLPEPAMPMDWLGNTRRIGPVARMGQAQGDLLRRRLAIPAHHKVVLLALGGVPAQLDLNNWPLLSDVTIITEPALITDGRRFRDWQQAHMSFIDILASVDLVIAKSGYGTFTEAACHGRPVLHVTRPDWPEEPYLVPWLQQHTNCRQITRHQLHTGDFIMAMDQLLAGTPVPSPPATGGDEATRIIMEFLAAT